MPPIPGGIPGFYCGVGLATSKDNGASFRKLGPVITGSQPKDLKGRADQGCGDLCVVSDAENRYLHVYYTDHSRIDRRGVQICVARSLRQDAAKTDSWRKFHAGAFTESGLGGRDTPIISAIDMGGDAIFPQVSYIEKLNRYVMVLNITIYREFAQRTKPQQSGIYIACSRDCIHWSKPTQLIAVRSIATLGNEVGWHPTLLVSSVESGAAKGWLYYSYSESWGHRAPDRPHYLVGQPITFSIIAE